MKEIHLGQEVYARFEENRILLRDERNVIAIEPEMLAALLAYGLEGVVRDELLAALEELDQCAWHFMAKPHPYNLRRLEAALVKSGAVRAKARGRKSNA